MLGAQPKGIVHALRQLVGGRIDNRLGDIRVDQPLADSHQKVGAGAELHRSALTALGQPDRARPADKGYDERFRRRRLVLKQEVGQLHAVARRKGNHVLGRVTNGRCRHEQ